MNYKQVKENREFGLIVGGVFVLIAAYAYFRKGHANIVCLAIGLVLITAAILIPLRLTLIKTGWEKLGQFLGYINTIVLLTVVYLVVVTPMAMLNRLFGKDPLKLKTNREAKSYWETSDTKDKLEMKQQF